jgi:hypothetical protein
MRLRDNTRPQERGRASRACSSPCRKGRRLRARPARMEGTSLAHPDLITCVPRMRNKRENVSFLSCCVSGVLQHRRLCDCACPICCSSSRVARRGCCAGWFGDSPKPLAHFSTFSHSTSPSRSLTQLSLSDHPIPAQASVHGEHPPPATRLQPPDGRPSLSSGPFPLSENKRHRPRPDQPSSSLAHFGPSVRAPARHPPRLAELALFLATHSRPGTRIRSPAAPTLILFSRRRRPFALARCPPSRSRASSPSSCELHAPRLISPLELSLLSS